MRVSLPLLLWSLLAVRPAVADPQVRQDASGRLVYVAADDGDRIPDFSVCGYRHGEEPPVAPVVLTLSPQPEGDDTERLRQALERVSALPPGRGGLRGALLLKKGEYRVGGALHIGACGVVLRGEGDGEGGTLLRATGKTARALITVGGGDFRAVGKPVRVVAARVPVGATRIPLATTAGFSVGQAVQLLRHGNAAWIHALGMDALPSRPDGKPVSAWEPFTLAMDRVILAVEKDAVVLDAPVACAVEERWGGGELVAAKDTRIENVGVENLRSISDHDASVIARRGKETYASDEAHATYLIEFGKVRNAWATGLTTLRYVQGPVALSAGGKAITVSRCASLEPVSVITGGRRYPFANNGAQQCLFRECVSDLGRHAFVYGARTVGPNVFLRCRSTRDLASSEPHHRWSVCGLYDNCETTLSLMNRGNMGSGHGWAGANYVAWNCRGTLNCESPPTARNFAFGHVGPIRPGPFRGPAGVIVSPGKPVSPESLYEAQLAERRRANGVRSPF